MPSSSSPVLVSLTDLRHSVRTRAGRVSILRGVDFQARGGQVTALLGPNGAGKTTTLTIAQGLERPESGTVRLLGEDPWRAGPALRSRVGVMLQDGGLPPSATPARLLRHVSSLYRDPADMAELVARLGIEEFSDRDIRRLSGGQRQRVALAAALAGRPRVVFLDEPSAGLDPVSRQLVFDLILDLKRAGLAVVLTTHLLHDAERLADHVVLMREGIVERSGTVAELTGSATPPPVHFRVPAPIHATAMAGFPAGLVLVPEAALPGVADDEDGEADRDGLTSAGRTFRVEGITSPEDWSVLADWWREHRIMPSDVRLLHRSLEDVFLEVAP